MISALVPLFAFWVSDPAPVPVMTVCQALQDRDRLHGKTIVVVGSLEGTDEGTWLSEECKDKVVTDGFTWPNSIARTYSREGADPPAGFQWDRKSLAAKLREVRKSTKLRRSQGSNERWHAMVGRFETHNPLQVASGADRKLRGAGFGHLGTSPAQLVVGGAGAEFALESNSSRRLNE